MSRLRLWSPLSPWIAIVMIVVLAQGCHSVPSVHSVPSLTTQGRLTMSAQDDFGRSYEGEEINIETVGRDAMIFNRTHLDLTLKGVFPIETNFEPTVGIGIKGSLEIAKELYLGLAFDWSHHEVDEGVDRIAGVPPDLAGVEGDELFDSIDRMNLLVTFDYDVRLDDPRAGGKPWRVRLGFGIGPLLILGEEDDFVRDQFHAAGGSFTVEPYVGMSIRPGIELRHQIIDGGHVFASAAFDWAVFPDKYDIKINGRRREVDDSIEFSAGMFGAGFAFEW